MAKQGFNGQWIEIARVGKFRDAKNVERDLTRQMFDQVAANFNAGEAPIVVGHPESDSAPAFGWTSEIRVNGDSLEARFSDTDEGFEKLVADGRFKKRSASFYLDPPNLRHVGFLGAQPPAIKGLRDIQFAEGESFAVESTINFKETEMGLEDKDVEKVTEGVFEKIKNFFTKETPPAGGSAANFSEADVKKLIADAQTEIEQSVTEKVTAEFKEQVETLTQANKDLLARVDGQTAGSIHAEIVSFVESIPAEKGKHFLKRAGVVEFMESLAVADAADGDKQAICFSEGTGDDKQEHKFSRVEWFKNYVDALPSFVEFGEKFGSIVTTSDADVMINTNRVNEMKKAAGVETKGGKD